MKSWMVIWPGIVQRLGGECCCCGEKERREDEDEYSTGIKNAPDTRLVVLTPDLSTRSGNCR